MDIKNKPTNKYYGKLLGELEAPPRRMSGPLYGDCYAYSVTAIAVLPNDQIACSYNEFEKGTSYCCFIWNLKTGKIDMLLRSHADSIPALTTLTNGRVATCCYDWSCRIWDTSTGKCLNTLTTNKGPINALATLPQSHLIIGGGRKYCFIWDILTGKLLFKIKVKISINHLEALTCGCLYVCGTNSFRKRKLRILKFPSVLPQQFLQSEHDCLKKQFHICTI